MWLPESTNCNSLEGGVRIVDNCKSLELDVDCFGQLDDVAFELATPVCNMRQPHYVTTYGATRRASGVSQVVRFRLVGQWKNNVFVNSEKFTHSPARQ